jgi:hypothetical protein
MTPSKEEKPTSQPIRISKKTSSVFLLGVVCDYQAHELRKRNLRRTGCSSLSTTLYSRDPLLSTHKNLLAVCTQFKGWLHYAWQKECAVHDMQGSVSYVLGAIMMRDPHTHKQRLVFALNDDLSLFDVFYPIYLSIYPLNGESPSSCSP